MTYSVYEFDSYRDLLQSIYRSKVQNQSQYLMSDFAELLGFSKSGLYLVLGAKRNLSVQKIHGIASALSFSAKEREYFEIIVLHEQAEDAMEKEFYGQRLFKLRSGINAKKMYTNSPLPIMSWFMPGLIVALNDFVKAEDSNSLFMFLENISTRLSVPKDELLAIVNLLKEENIIRKNIPGIGDKNIHVTIAKKGNEEAIRAYLNDVLDRAKEFIPAYFNEGDVKFASETIALDAKHFSKLRDGILQVLEKFKNVEFDCLEKPGVYQTIFSMFPVFRNQDIAVPDAIS